MRADDIADSVVDEVEEIGIVDKIEVNLSVAQLQYLVQLVGQANNVNGI